MNNYRGIKLLVIAQQIRKRVSLDEMHFKVVPQDRQIDKRVIDPIEIAAKFPHRTLDM